MLGSGSGIKHTGSVTLDTVNIVLSLFFNLSMLYRYIMIGDEIIETGVGAESARSGSTKIIRFLRAQTSHHY
jgi:hypothetical protein